MTEEEDLDLDCPICYCTVSQSELITMRSNEVEDDWNNCADLNMFKYSCSMGHLFYVPEEMLQFRPTWLKTGERDNEG